MTYYTGCVAAVPKANRQRYVDHARAAWPLMRRHGARRMVETWSDEVTPGKRTDFLRAVQAGADEAVVFSWMEWPDRATCDAAFAQLRPEDMPAIPFDGSRMIWGGFAPVMAEGTDRNAGFYQGFVLPVPPANRAAYVALAHEAWNDMFRPHGCTGIVEAWGEDVPHGRQTDLYRAVEATGDEEIVFSWTAWPDRATCEAAARAMEADMDGQPMPEVPFDAKRMIFAGFAPIFDSDRAEG